MDRVQIINRLISEFGLKRYLEIGVWRGDCLSKVRCEEKLGVDPNPIYQQGVLAISSDEFFAQYDGAPFDLVLVDGLHECRQTYRDLENSLAIVGDDGFVVCHDCMPTHEIEQRVPCEQEIWLGDVWKAIHALRLKRPDISFTTFDCDFGCCVLHKNPSVGFDGQSVLFGGERVDWAYYLKHGEKFLNLKPASHFDQFVQNLHAILVKKAFNKIYKS